MAEANEEAALNGILSLPADLPADAGFKTGSPSVITSRTIMFAELQALLSTLPAAARPSDYRAAIIEENALLKRSAATRRSTAKHLAELYALDPRVPIFRVLRRLWDAEEAGRPLLAFLCAQARDPLLRMTTLAVLPCGQGTVVSAADIARSVEHQAPGRFSANTLGTVARNAASSWTQSGHLRGQQRKVRTLAAATPASTAYALALGYLAGARGAVLFATYWTALLDAPPEAVDALAFEAGRRGWLDYRRIGNVVEIGFGDLLEDGPHRKVRALDDSGPRQHGQD
jgi:hypothetical protein